MMHLECERLVTRAVLVRQGTHIDMHNRVDVQHMNGVFVVLMRSQYVVERGDENPALAHE